MIKRMVAAISPVYALVYAGYLYEGHSHLDIIKMLIASTLIAVAVISWVHFVIRK